MAGGYDPNQSQNQGMMPSQQQYGMQPPPGYGGYAQPQQQMGMMAAGGAPMMTPGGSGPKGVARNPLHVMLLCMFTFGVYPLVWYMKTYNEVQGFLNRGGPPWWKVLLISMVTCQFYGLYLVFTRLGGIIAEVQQRAGVQNPQNLGFMYLIPAYGPFLVQTELNKAWQTPG